MRINRDVAAGVPLEPALEKEQDQTLVRLCAQLSDEAFAAAWEEGLALPLPEAIAAAQSIADD